MKRPRLRSTGVSTAAVATATERPDESRVAFEALYRGSRDDLYAYVSGLLRDRSAAEEVTAQVFERAWRKRRQVNRRRGTARTWLFGIARNAALDELRRRKRVETAELPPPSSEPGPDEAAQLAAERDAVRRALGTLPAKDRELIALKYHADLTNGDIAEVLGVNANHVGTLLHRAMNKLREAVDA